MLDSLFVSLSNISHVLRTEITRVSENLEEATDALLKLILSFLGNIGGLVHIIEMGKELVQ